MTAWARQCSFCSDEEERFTVSRLGPTALNSSCDSMCSANPSVISKLQLPIYQLIQLTLQGLFCSLRTELYCLTKQISTFFPSWNMQRPKITARHNDDNHLPYYQMYFHIGPCLQAEVLN